MTWQCGLNYEYHCGIEGFMVSGIRVEFQSLSSNGLLYSKNYYNLSNP
jgi:hypothetical protein